MSHETYELTAVKRDRAGKGSSRALRRNGQIPAVIYGAKKPPVRSTAKGREERRGHPPGDGDGQGEDRAGTDPRQRDAPRDHPTEAWPWASRHVARASDTPARAPKAGRLAGSRSDREAHSPST